MPTLLLLRHAKTENIAPGAGDIERALTERGHLQAAAVGDWLRAEQISVDQVLCSPAVRTRQTLEGLDLNCPVVWEDSIYQASSPTIATAIAQVEDTVQTLLVIGHAPGIPTLAHDLAGADSTPSALAQIATGYPTATLTRVEVDSWSDFGASKVTDVHLAK